VIVAKRPTRPRRVIVSFRGIDHEMNVSACRVALVKRQVAGEFDSMEQLADAIGCSRSTASRYFAGRSHSLAVALAVLDKLKLRFEDVYTPCKLDEPSGPPERAV
jgi:transcriptional regulator with XRE-family HTH domain